MPQVQTIEQRPFGDNFSGACNWAVFTPTKTVAHILWWAMIPISNFIGVFLCKRKINCEGTSNIPWPRKRNYDFIILLELKIKLNYSIFFLKINLKQLLNITTKFGYIFSVFELTDINNNKMYKKKSSSIVFNLIKICSNSIWLVIKLKFIYNF